MMKATSPVEFLRAVNLFDVIRGSNTVKATTLEMKTKINVKNNVTIEWNKCIPYQQITSGKLSMTLCPVSSEVTQLTTESKSSIIGKNKTVTKRGTILASTIKGQVNLNFFFEKE